MVSNGWRQEIDKILGDETLEYWTKKQTTPQNFSLTRILNEMEREAACARVSRVRDKNAYCASLMFDGDGSYCLPGKSLLINTSSVDPSLLDLRKLDDRSIICDFLVRVSGSLRVLVLHSLDLPSPNFPCSTMNFLNNLLLSLTNLEIFVLHKVGSFDEQGMLKGYTSPVFLSELDPTMKFSNLKKLVISQVSLDVAEYIFYKMGPYAKEIEIVDLFLRTGLDGKNLLTPFTNALNSFGSLEKISLEFTELGLEGIIDISQHWHMTCSILETGFPNLRYFSVVFLSHLSVSIPQVLLLVSGLPKIRELTIFVHDVSYVVDLYCSQPEVDEMRENGFSGLQKLRLGTNILTSDEFCGLMQFVGFMTSVKSVNFEDIGCSFVELDEVWLGAMCNRHKLRLFQTMPALEIIKAKLGNFILEIPRSLK